MEWEALLGESAKVSIKEKLSKVDKAVLGKAVALMLMSWAALPIIYFILLRRKKENDRHVNIVGDNGDTTIHSS